MCIMLSAREGAVEFYLVYKAEASCFTTKQQKIAGWDKPSWYCEFDHHLKRVHVDDE